MTCRTAINQHRPLFGPYIRHGAKGSPIMLMVDEGKREIILTDEDALRLADQALRAYSSNQEAKRLMG